MILSRFRDFRILLAILLTSLKQFGYGGILDCIEVRWPVCPVILHRGQFYAHLFLKSINPVHHIP
jgi:hypothetical protein